MGPNPTEPANYRGSNTRVSKEIADIEIGMCRNARIVTTTGIITIVPIQMVTTTMESVAQADVSEEGLWRN